MALKIFLHLLSMGAKGREDGVGDLCNLADLEF